MTISPFRVVLDTNTLLRGLASESSPAAEVLRHADRRSFVLLLSRPVLKEYRAVLGGRKIQERFRSITPEYVEGTLRRLRFLADFVHTPKARFEFPRDVLDQKFIELAIDMNASHIISGDADLLELPRGSGEAARRFRQRLRNTTVMNAADFLQAQAAAMRK